MSELTPDLDVEAYREGLDKFHRSSSSHLLTYIEAYLEGRVDQAQQMLLHLAERRFGQPPDPQLVAVIRSIDRLNLLVRLTDRVIGPWSWDQLLTKGEILDIKQAFSTKGR